LDKIESSRNGMAQMALYIFQAHVDAGCTPAEAKLKVAREIERLYDEYTAQANISPKLVKSITSLVYEANRYATELEKASPSIAMKLLKRKTTEVVEALKRG
jgi:hypothetical protein